MSNPIFTGSGVAIVTPLNENGIDFDELAKLIDYNIENGLSPDIFLDIDSYSLYQKLKIDIDWNTLDITVYGPINPYSNVVDIVIYIDQNYVNNYIINRDNAMESRV